MPLPQRVYALHSAAGTLVAGLADRLVQVQPLDVVQGPASHLQVLLSPGAGTGRLATCTPPDLHRICPEHYSLTQSWASVPSLPTCWLGPFAVHCQPLPGRDAQTAAAAIVLHAWGMPGWGTHPRPASGPCTVPGSECRRLVCTHPVALLRAGHAKLTLQVTAAWQVFDLRKPAAPLHAGHAKLTRQLTCVACFPDGSGYLEGSVEGRIAVNHLNAAERGRDFSFKAHRHARLAWTQPSRRCVPCVSAEGRASAAQAGSRAHGHPGAGVQPCCPWHSA